MRSICSKTLGFAVSSSSFILWKISSRPSCWDRFLSPWSDLPPIFLYIMAGFLAFVENFRIPRDQFTVNVHLRRALHFVKLCCEENIPFKDKFTQKLRFDHDLRPWVPMESRAKLWSINRYLELSSVATTEVNGGRFENVKKPTEKPKLLGWTPPLKAVTVHPLTSPPRPNLKDCR